MPDAPQSTLASSPPRTARASTAVDSRPDDSSRSDPGSTFPSRTARELGEFAARHIGPSAAEERAMLEALELESIGALIDEAVPGSIRLARSLRLPPPATEAAALAELEQLASQNRLMRSVQGMGYSDCFTPPVIQRNVLENPGWYTAYTPYQPEISQGRLEALLAFQTLVTSLTGLEIANASLLDEATAAAEAMALAFNVARGKSNRFVVATDCHPQTVEVVATRARPLGIEIEMAEPEEIAPTPDVFGVLVQFPGTTGRVRDFSELARQTHEAGGLLIAAADLLSSCLLRPPGEWGADIAVGSTQRFGMPLGYGGPHAAYFATLEKHKRRIPGRLVGISRDADGQQALRLALQTREQHIRRDKATSNICTAQVLPAVVAAMYAVYHGPEGLRAIAGRVAGHARELSERLVARGQMLRCPEFFDTLHVEVTDEKACLAAAAEAGYNLRAFGDGTVGISLDETTDPADVDALDRVLEAFATPGESSLPVGVPEGLRRSSAYLEDRIFREHRSETQMLRYLHRLEARDLSLTTSMIPLGSCTMKLNATAEMMPVTWPGFARIHPFAPKEQCNGYDQLCAQLEEWLAELTGFAAISLQPNAGSQGEYAGLLVIRQYHESRGEHDRDVCLIPTSAHGTNPASAVMAGLRVVAVACDDDGNIDTKDLRAKAEQHADRLAALMVTYPSTHGVFEESIIDVTAMIHRFGGQVYMDGANMNAQVGLCRPGDFGADVCHLNLHKTFCIPHGGGGPGMGPIGVAEHLAPFLPGHATTGRKEPQQLGAISAAPVGSGAILPISWAYIRMMGAAGLTRATEIAILNANYMARKLEGHYNVLYRGRNGRVAHECILDLRPFKDFGVEVDDVAKRLIDFGFHAPTMSFPVAGTLMVEPTESEDLAEIDRFCEAMIAIREEIRQVETGEVAAEASVLRHAPHTAQSLVVEDWTTTYSRRQAAFPAAWTHEHKYWPPVARVDNAFGDRNLVCSCAGMEAYRDDDTDNS